MSTAIKVEGLSKKYKLGLTHAGSLRELVNGFASQLAGRKPAAARTVATEHADRVDDEGYFWALKDISFEIPQGEVVGIIGKNGAGKSTLLKLLSRITSPSSGTIEYRGRIASLLEVGTGFHPELTGRENVYMNGTILGMTRREIDRQFEAIVEFAGVEKFIDTPVKRYSSGMTVRLGFAVAAHLDPEILIVDEVLAVGDIEFQEKCLGKMQEVSESGKTVLFVSHNMASIRTLTTQAIMISRGEIAYQGPTSQAVTRYIDENLHHAKVSRDVSKLERPFSGLTRELNITELSWVENLEATITEGDCPVFEMTIHASREHEDFELGITIFRDDHTPVGSTFSPSLPRLESGEVVSLRFKLPTESLTPGRYHCAISLAEARAQGRRIFDSLSDVLAFSIEPAGSNIRPWNSAWGTIRLNETELNPIPHSSRD